MQHAVTSKGGIQPTSYLCGFTGSTTALRQALLIGFANRLARRMTTHNGYKTLSEPSTLAQLHPSTARIAADDDGLLPEWVIYHELVATSRIFLSRVRSLHSMYALMSNCMWQLLGEFS